WQFSVNEDIELAGDRREIKLDGGFQPGKIYELVYHAKDPAVVGLALAAVRDFAAFAKYGEPNPFPVRHAIAFGVSQSGRFLRHFLYEGFNCAETRATAEAPVFDGMFIHAAGAGRGSFNHRFAQPSRDAHRYSAFFYPTDLFPFSSRAQCDKLTGRCDGLLERQIEQCRPKIMQTNTGYEYWGRAASLSHSSWDGRSDVLPHDSERLYHIAGAQHFVGDYPPRESMGTAFRGNPLDFSVNLRALMVRLVDWVALGREPPASRIPRLSDGTLVPIESYRFPAIANVPPAEVAHAAYRADYGPRWDNGIIDFQPPKLGPAFPSLVPQVNVLGNEIAGIQNVELAAPLATYVPWNLRGPGYANPGELTDFLGTYVPLARTEADRVGDARSSIAVLYPDRESYLARASDAADRLLQEGFLLKQDRERVLKRASGEWDRIMRR
ncbi:MAG TPA: alpha/beta hydrolase domain-containing protein, partial [Burkholderiales bacterium]|nr:alpha/beta hydrolase domain-containing protein [Burkholderiales bacterium]